MRKVFAQPLALVLSMVVLIALAVCGNGLKTTRGVPAQLPRSPLPTGHTITASTPTLYATAISTVMLVAAARMRASLALVAGMMAAQDETAVAEAASVQAPTAAEKLATAATLAGEMLALLAFCAQAFALNARRRFAAFCQNDTRPLPLSRLAEHRIAPAP